MSLRKVTSLTILLSFILLLITSIILYITPQGKVAYWASWSCWGIGKEEWSALHTNLGILFLIAGIIHIMLNWKPMVFYLKNRSKKLKVFTIDFNISLMITLLVTLLTLLSLPPLNGIQHFNESLKDAAAEKYGEPPYGHAEASTLKIFCRRMDINLKEALKKLKAADLKKVSTEATLAEIAQANAMPPQQVYLLIKPTDVAGIKTDIVMKHGMGFGRKTLRKICKENGLDVLVVQKDLGGLGIESEPDWSIKKIAEQNNMEPVSVFEAIQQLQRSK